MMPPTLTILNPEAAAERTLIVLHGNAMTPNELQPYYDGLIRVGWRVVVACSGQEKDSKYIWNNFSASDEAIRGWASDVGGRPYWAGFSAAAYLLLKNALQGQIPAAGLLCVAPSLLRHPQLWPTNWTEPPTPVPTAFILGDTDDYLKKVDTDEFITDLTNRGVPTHTWRHPGAHEHPAEWPRLRTEALDWLTGEHNRTASLR